jgi:hypothetical protein
MPDLGIKDATPPDRYIPLAMAVELTGKNEQLIRVYARKKLIRTMRDPEDRRRTMVHVDDLGKIVMQPTRGRRMKPVDFTLSDGTVIRKMIPVANGTQPRARPATTRAPAPSRNRVQSWCRHAAGAADPHSVTQEVCLRPTNYPHQRTLPSTR